MAPTAAIDIPIIVQQQNDENLNASLESAPDDIFSPIDSLSTSLSSVSFTQDIFDNELDIVDQLKSCELEQSITSKSDLKFHHNDIVLDKEDDVVQFGRGPQAWWYHPQSGIFDLSRRSTTKIHVPSYSDNMTGLLVDPAQTILVVVDMQNFFIHSACHPHLAGQAAVKPLLRVMDKCRALGIQVSFLNWVIEEKDMFEMPPAVQRGWSADRLRTHGVGWNVNLGSELPNGQGRCLWKGSWNAELYAPIKQSARTEDAVFLKNRPSGMWSEDCDMAKYLKEHKLKTVLFAGVNTDQCVLGTLTDCYSKSYDCVMISDCVGTATTGLMAQELVEYNVSRNYGFVIDSNCVMQSRLLNF